MLTEIPNLIEQELFEKIVSLLSPVYVENGKISLRELADSTPYHAVTVEFPGTVYRPTGSAVIVRIKTGGKIPYIAFPERAAGVLHENEIEYHTIKSESPPWLRVSPDEFIAKCDLLRGKIDTILVDAFSFSSFGCC